MPGTLWAQTLCYASYKEFYMSLCQAFAAGSTDKGCLPKVDTGFGTKDTRKIKGCLPKVDTGFGTKDTRKIKACLPKVDTGFGTKDTRKKTMTGPDKGTGHGA